jgi:hypothetical protein
MQVIHSDSMYGQSGGRLSLLEQRNEAHNLLVCDRLLQVYREVTLTVFIHFRSGDWH